MQRSGSLQRQFGAVDLIWYFFLEMNFGDAKPVGDGVFEMRIDYGSGYRLYYALRGNEPVLLLIGGNKSSQQRDIAKAKKLNQGYE